MAKSFIIVPTYNERSNIGILLEKIFSLNLPDLGVLVVDDNSPDGTGRLVEELKSKYQNLDILHRANKAGLGAAYLAGFAQALKQGVDYIFEMDADLSHNPEYLPNFLQAIQSADLVLGSRYIKNGE
jgi:dolichol-phosphate mannosyltransferase